MVKIETPINDVNNISSIRFAEYIGEDVVNVKIKVMMLGSTIAGIAGSLWSFYLVTVLSAAYTRTDWKFFLIVNL